MRRGSSLPQNACSVCVFRLEGVFGDLLHSDGCILGLGSVIGDSLRAIIFYRRTILLFICSNGLFYQWIKLLYYLFFVLSQDYIELA
jgi:hypothetical protein